MQGKIYKIIHNQSNLCYVGATFDTLSNRWQSHKNAYKRNKNNISIYKHFQKYGIENFKMILIKQYDVVDRLHLHMYETLWILKLKSVNKIKPFNIKPLYSKNYYLSNKENILDSRKIFYQINKQKLKNYYDSNKEKFKAYQKERYHRLKAERLAESLLVSN